MKVQLPLPFLGVPSAACFRTAKLCAPAAFFARDVTDCESIPCFVRRVHVKILVKPGMNRFKTLFTFTQRKPASP